MTLRPATLALLSVCAVLLIAYVAMEFAFPTALQKDKLLDFDAFHLAGVMISEGNLVSAYDPEIFVARQSELAGFNGTQLLWSYPPTFDLIVAPLGLLPAWLAYSLFMVATLTGCVWVLRKLSAEGFHTVLIMALPVMALILRSGQNSFLMAALIGLTCSLALRKSPFAGVPLGLMAIKPHLAVGFGIWALTDRRWTLAATSLATVAAFCAVSYVILGAQAWQAFLGGLSATGQALQDGNFSLFRMSSVYAFGVSVGLGHGSALAFHVTVIVLTLAALVRLMQLGLKPRDAMGAGVVFSALVSPYNYDYDLAILTIAASLLFSTVSRQAKAWEKRALFAAAWTIGWYSFAVTIIMNKFGSGQSSQPTALLGLVLLATACITFRVLRRDVSAQTGEAQRGLA